MVSGQQKQIKAISMGKNSTKKDLENSLRTQLPATPVVENDNQLFTLADSNAMLKSQGRNQTSHARANTMMTTYPKMGPDYKNFNKTHQGKFQIPGHIMKKQKSHFESRKLSVQNAQQPKFQQFSTLS